MGDSFHSIMSDMESSFLTIFIDAAAKMADLTKSKLFVVFQSSDGSRQIGGNNELVSSFQSGFLMPQPSDGVLGERTERFHTGLNLEADFANISGVDVGNVTPRTDCGYGGNNKVGEKRHFDSTGWCVEGRKRYKPNDDAVQISSLVHDQRELREMKPALNSEEKGVEGDVAYADYADQDPDYDPRAKEWHEVLSKEALGGTNFVHKTRERRRCGLCPPHSGKTYTLDNYRKHKAAVHDKKLACPKCSKGFASLYYLNRHNCKRQDHDHSLPRDVA